VHVEDPVGPGHDLDGGDLTLFPFLEQSRRQTDGVGPRPSGDAVLDADVVALGHAQYSLRWLPSPELTLHLERVVPAPRPRLFGVFVEAAELASWWGPRGFTSPAIDLDLRVGGSYRITMQPPEGDAFHLAGEYVVIDPPSRLSYTFRWVEPTPDDVETVVTISLREVDGTTEVNVEQGVFATEERLALHTQGWNDSLERLDQLVSSWRTV
jgi:uncharacterized protein YndB with AHSA1/START domain